MNNKLKPTPKYALLGLKARIKGLAEEIGNVAKLKDEAKTVSKKAFYEETKRKLSKEARYHLIAYGLLRGKEHSEIEPSPSLHKLKFEFDYNYLVEILNRYTWFYQNKKLFSVNNLRTLLTTGVWHKPLKPKASSASEVKQRLAEAAQ